MSWHVFPSEQDIGNWRGSTSKWPREFQWAGLNQLIQRSHLSGFLVSGMAVSNGGGLNAAIAAGEVCIEGFAVANDEAASIAVQDGATNYIYVRLLKTDGVVTGAEYCTNTTGVAPSEPNCLIGRVTTSGGAISGTPLTSKALPGILSGTIAPGESATVFLGFQPAMVYCCRRNTSTGEVSDFTLGLSIGFGFGRTGGIGANAINLQAAAAGSNGVPTIEALGFTSSLTATGVYEVRWMAVV